VSISGNISTMPCADLFQWVAQSRKTGTLVVDGPRFTKKVYFREGLVVGASSENPREFLSYFLVGWGILAEEELPHMFELQEKHGTMLGELLVILGRLSREELDRVLTVKTEETIYDLFLWDEGAFRFLDDVLPAGKLQELAIPVDRLILEGVRRRDEWARMREVVPGPDHVPKVVRAIDVSRLGPVELAILREADGKTSMERIALACRIPTFTVMQFVYHAVRGGLMELLEPLEGEEREIPGVRGTTWRLLVRDAERAVAEGRLLEAWRAVHEMEAKYGQVRKARELAAAVRGEIEVALERAGLDERAVPELAVPQEELLAADCGPEQGFLLSRINGIYTLGEILKLVPGERVENLLLVHDLVTRGLVRLRQVG